ncbi:MAG TPA: SIR2 family protein [Thermoanaerobaculia bacterium]|nr:SIR2 family protein [Thermoanaerobaculia bacterium]
MSGDPIDDLTFVSEVGRRCLYHLAHELALGDVVLFAGAGLSFNAQSVDGSSNHMPGWEHVSNRLRSQLEQDVSAEPDPLRVADYYQTAFGRKALIDAVMESIKDNEHRPGRVHECITTLNFREIITTNYDTLLERAFEAVYLDPQVVISGRDLVHRRRPPRIIKVNGCFRRDASSIVITGDDFLAQMTQNPLLDVFVTKSFVESQVLFVGFGLNDPAFRRINESVLRNLGNDCPLAYSIQFGTTTTKTDYWRSRQIEVIDLFSGEKHDLNPEERLFRVLTALLKKQRPIVLERRERPTRIESTGSADADKKTAEDADRKADEAAGTLAVALPHIGAAKLRAMCDPKMSYSLWSAAETAMDRAKSTSPARKPFRLLAELLRILTRVDDSSLTLDAEAWRRFFELGPLTADIPAVGSVGDAGTTAELAVMNCLASLHLAIAIQSFAPDGQLPHEAVGLPNRLLDDAERVSLNCLVTQEMPVRSRHLLLACLFSPLDELLMWGSMWTLGGKEQELVELSASRVEPTPEEYRAPTLSFLGKLQEQPALYQRAAESLWARPWIASLTYEEAMSAVETAFRYRYLVRSAENHARDWPGARLHQERLESVLGRFSFHSREDHTRASVTRALDAILTDMSRGWLFGSPAMPAMTQAWRAAREATRKGKVKSVPWFVLIVFSLCVEGEKGIETNKDLLFDAWHAQALEASSMLRYIARRARGTNFTSLNRYSEGKSRTERPIALYEDALAFLTSLLIGRIDEDAAGSPSRAEALDTLSTVVSAWARATNSTVARRRLISALVLMRGWDPDRMKREVQMWIDVRVSKGPLHGSLQLAELDPPDGSTAVKVDQIRLLLAQARSSEANGTDFRADIERWLTNWSRKPTALDAVQLADFAGAIADWIRYDEDGFEWIARAANVRRSPTLCEHVEHCLDPKKPLARYVIERLSSMSVDAVSRWMGARSSFLAPLAEFAEDLDEQASAYLAGVVDGRAFAGTPREEQHELTTDGKDGAVILGSAFLTKNLEPERWRAIISEMIQCGATGNGRLGAAVERVSCGDAQKLQENLIIRLHRLRDSAGRGDAVVSIGRTLRDNHTHSFNDLEWTLSALLLVRDRVLSMAAGTALLLLSTTRPEIIIRNRNRIARALNLITKTHFRESNSIVQELRSAISSVAPSTLTVAAPVRCSCSEQTVL